MKFYHGLIIILVLLFISASSSYIHSLDDKAQEVYEQINTTGDEKIGSISHQQTNENYRRFIEMILIFMPISWIVIYIYLKLRGERLGSTDFLTKLPNRRALDNQKRKFDVQSTTIIYLDLDNLKKINDTINHKEGDKLIVAFTERLKAISHKKTIFRVGGDEFILVFRGKTDLFVEQLSKIQQIEDSDIEVNRFAFSAGVVESKHFDIASFDEAVSIADYTMYEAKSMGKGNILKASQKHVDEYRMTNYIKIHMERTCKSRGFIPFFQPFIDSKSGSVIGFETLVRMRIGSGYAPNEHLIKQARELNLLKAIDLQMFEESIKFARNLKDRGLANDKWVFNSNFSAHTLARVKLEDLYGITKLYGIDPSQVVIEITEDELLEKSIKEFLSNYKKYGFKIAIDDFGAAYSSFVRLLEIKPDIMKIDRSLLTTDISTNHDMTTIYNNMIHLGHDLNSTITAEGVENIEQIALLKTLGVETLQGFHFARPMPMEEFIKFAEQRHKQQPLTYTQQS